MLARNRDISGALALADQVSNLAATSDDPRDSADAALNRAEITCLAGEPGEASELISQSHEHYQRKGATASVARTRRLAAQWGL
jgi:hypothetical protein